MTYDDWRATDYAALASDRSEERPRCFWCSDCVGDGYEPCSRLCERVEHHRSKEADGSFDLGAAE